MNLDKGLIPLHKRLKMFPVDSLTCYKTDDFLIKRIGSEYDGGYVIVDGLDYDLFLSFGIDKNDKFEHDFLNIHKNIKCLAYDGSVDKLPNYHDRIIFHKKWISDIESGDETNLHRIINKYDNIFLKIDIEGSEYKWIHSLSPDMLSRFSQIIIEFHNPFCEYYWNCIEKLNKTHYLLHIHGNNNQGIKKCNNIIVPNCFECTYINKNLISNIKLNLQRMQDFNLDQKCVSHKDEIFLEGYPYNLEKKSKKFTNCLNNKFLYLVISFEGMASIFSILYSAIEFCKKTNRTLIFNGDDTCYNHTEGQGPRKKQSGLNLVNFFDIDYDILLDSNQINDFIKSNQELSIYPNGLDIKNTKYTWSKENQCVMGSYNDNTHCFTTKFNDYDNLEEDILIFAGGGGAGNAIKFMNEYFIVSEYMKNYFESFYNKINKPYLSIQVRNTDRFSDYKKLYIENKDLLHSYNNIFLATDDYNTLKYFKEIDLNIYNFTKFSENYSKSSFHKGDIDSNLKIGYTLLDLYLMSKSDKIISNSVGGYIILANKLHDQKYSWD